MADVHDARITRHIRRFQQGCAALIGANRLEVTKRIVYEINRSTFLIGRQQRVFAVRKLVPLAARAHFDAVFGGFFFAPVMLWLRGEVAEITD